MGGENVLKMSVADIVARYPQTRETLEELGVDYCCGGKRDLASAAEAAGRGAKEVGDAVTAAIEKGGKEEQAGEDFTAMSPVELTKHIEAVHHTFMREQLPLLAGLLDKVRAAHDERHGEMLGALEDVLTRLRTDIEMHLAKEEQILFPYIAAIEGYAKGAGPAPEVHCGSVQNPIRQMEYEHDEVGAMLSEVREITSGLQVPADGCATFEALYDGLGKLEEDLHQHIHLENNILFPKAVELEERTGAGKGA